MNNVLKLPDCYAKTKDSNNYKLLHLNELVANDFKKDMKDCFTSLDLTQATGKTLDLYGTMYGQKRGSLSDSQYRAMILAKAVSSVTNATAKDVAQKLSSIFKFNPNSISFSDTSTSGETKISNLSLEAITTSGFTYRQAIDIISAFIPVGVRIVQMEFSGTFEFGIGVDTYDQIQFYNYKEFQQVKYSDLEEGAQYDEGKGFGNVEQTTGGCVGGIVTESQEV